MSFKDKVAAGAVLIKEALQSGDFLTQVRGWQIRRDGTAEFSSLVARGDLQITAPAPNDFTLSVRDNTVRLLNSGVAWAYDTPAVTTKSTAIPGDSIIFPDTLFQEVTSQLDFEDQALIGNDKRIKFTLHVDASVRASAAGAGGHFQMRYVYQDGTSDTDFRMEDRYSGDVGNHMVSMTWFDDVKLSEMDAWTSFPTNVGPYLAIRHTGATAYVLDWYTYTITYQVYSTTLG